VDIIDFIQCTLQASNMAALAALLPRWGNAYIGAPAWQHGSIAISGIKGTSIAPRPCQHSNAATLTL
jgi:hypothetical protein